MSSRLTPPKSRSRAFTIPRRLLCFLVELDVEDVDAREPLEEDALPFHDRLAAERPDVAQAQHRRAVRDDRHEVALARGRYASSGSFSMARQGRATPGVYAEREVSLRHAGLRGDDLELTRPGLFAGTRRRLRR